MPTDRTDHIEIRVTAKLDCRVSDHQLEQLLDRLRAENYFPRCNGFVVGYREPYAWLAFQTTDVHLERWLEGLATGVLHGWIMARTDEPIMR